MRKYFRRYRKRVYKRKAPSKAKAMRSYRNKKFNYRVRRTLSRVTELKKANYSQNNFALTSVLSANMDQNIKFLNPSSATGALFNIAQGSGQGSRIGNKITTKKCLLSGVVHINTEWSAQNWNMCPLYVALYVFKCKVGVQSVADVETIVQNRFFAAGNSSTGFSGTLRDLMMEPNKDVITLLRKKIVKVGTGTVQSATASGTANVLNQSYNDSQATIARMFRVDLTKALAKTFVYNDNDNTPINSATYIMWVPIRVDGGLIQTSAGLATGTVPAYVDFSIDYHYMDL